MVIQLLDLPERSNNYHRNAERHAGVPCVLCGKKVETKKSHWDLVVVSGYAVARSDEEAKQYEIDRCGSHAGDYGAEPIGPDCLRNHPDLKEYAIRSEGWSF